MSDSSQTNGVPSQQEVKQPQTFQAQPAAPVQAPAAPAAPVAPVNVQGQQASQQAPQAQAPTPQATPLQAPAPVAPAAPVAKAQPPKTEPPVPEAAPPVQLSKREIENQNLLNLRDLNDDEVNSIELHQLLKAKARAIGICEENDTSELTPEERARMSWAIHSDTQVTLEHIPHQVFFQKVWCLGPSERLDTLVRNLTGSAYYRSGGDHITVLDTATRPQEE